MTGPVATLTNMPNPPDVIAFDVLGTLVPLTSLEPLLVEAGAAPPAVDAWFRRLLAVGFALTATNDFRSFSDVAEGALASLVPDAPGPAREAVLAGLAELEPHIDSAPAMGRAVTGARVIVVTNSSAQSTRRLLERGGLDAFVEEVVSVEDAGAWKPAAAAYLHAAEVAGVPGPRLAMVTAHPWDVHGARRARLITGWCNRDESRYPDIFDRADVEGPELLSVVEGLLSLS